ncbi:hypothetical protein V7122_19345 [Bacillus sp. JJ1532]|uniref:hypothetical protein n=1 Tax=Bacillus sp. JJ1532 TaxID=3122958 RepID=UPI002FFFD2BE
MKSGDIKNYRQLSQFRDLKDFNNQFEQHMLDLKDNFTKSELVALKRLVRFSASIAGVCYAKIQTVVAATHEHDGVGISRSTFKRMLTKAKEVGLLVVHNTFKNGKQGHSVYVFNCYSSISNRLEPPSDEKMNHHETSNLLESSSNIKELRTSSVKSINQSIKQPISLLPAYIDSGFAGLSSYYFSDSDTVELFRIATIHSRMAKLSSDAFKLASVEGLKVLAYKVKTEKVKSVRGYFDGIMKKLCRKYWLKESFLSMFEG